MSVAVGELMVATYFLLVAGWGWLGVVSWLCVTYHVIRPYAGKYNNSSVHSVMARKTYHEQVRHSYLIFMMLWDLILPPHEEDLTSQIQFDISILEGIRKTCYLQPHNKVAKSGNLRLAWLYVQNLEDHGCFINMLCVSPHVFEFLLALILDHDVFKNKSNNPQMAVDVQLAVTLYHMGCFGNGASLKDLARAAGCSEGAVEQYTSHCFVAIESFHDVC